MWLGFGMEGWTLDVAGGRGGGVDPGCGWGLGWRDGPWMWLGVGVEGWTLDMAGGRGGGMYPGCGRG